MDRFWCYATI